MSATAAAETLNVPGDHDTIQAAVDAANDGDTINVKKAVYDENVVIDGDRPGENNLLIRGKNKPTIDPQGNGIGITIVNATGITVTGLNVTNAGDDGIFVLGSNDITLSKINCSNNGDSGVEITDSDNVTVEKGRFDDNGDDGVHFSDDMGPFATNCTVEKCKMNRGRNGVSGGGAGHMLIRNTMKDTNADSVFTNDDATGWVLERNKIIGSKDNGMVLQGSSHTSLKNTTKSANDDGTDVDGDGHTLTQDKHIKPKSDGVEFEEDTATNVTVTKVKVVKPGQDGVEIDGTGHVVDGCKVIKCGDAAFKNTGGVGNVFKNCRAKNSAVFDFEDNEPEGASDIGENNNFAPAKVVFDQ